MDLRKNRVKMANFIKRRLQVFVSSTYTDLIEERQAAVAAILNAGHIPAGMELFTSGDESQMEVIKQWIDESDVYLLILGGRYGSVDKKTDKSYTQLEYEYAIEKNKPHFFCVLSEAAINRKAKKSKNVKDMLEQENPQKLKDFRNLVTHNKIIGFGFCQSNQDIQLNIIRSLNSFDRRDDLIGWVRPHQEVNLPALSDEITRLSKENAELRHQLSQQKVQKETFNGLTFNELKQTLEKDSLLQFIEKNRLALIQGITISDITPPQEANRIIERLLNLGVLNITSLIRTSTNLPVFRLAPSGVAFLNKLEVEKLKLVENISSLAIDAN
jgi:hypothetical protein